MSEIVYTQIIQSILTSYNEIGGINHLDGFQHPSRKSIEDIIDRFKEILFPGFFETIKLDGNNLEYVTGQKIIEVSELLKQEIYKSFCWLCDNKSDCLNMALCLEKATQITTELLQNIPELRKLLKLDSQAIFKGDPAATHESEIILAYPGFLAITVYRIAHALYLKKVPLIPRLMTEIVHSQTGIDIHPGATIGHSFCIDHGTGIVIGETAELGNHVKLYQGVTIGALSVPDRSNSQDKRHPTIGDNVTLYAKTTILGGDTVIGANSTIGGNTWITASVPPYSKVYFTGEKQVHKTFKL